MKRRHGRISWGQQGRRRRALGQSDFLSAPCDSEPGQCIPDVFYGADERDADGNKFCFCHFG